MSELEWDEALELCDEIEEMLQDLPDRAAAFAQSVGEKIEDMGRWIEENEHVTQNQIDALQNMKSGCEKWLQ
jgi:hypothetical protein